MEAVLELLYGGLSKGPKKSNPLDWGLKKCLNVMSVTAED